MRGPGPYRTTLVSAPANETHCYATIYIMFGSLNQFCVFFILFYYLLSRFNLNFPSRFKACKNFIWHICYIFNLQIFFLFSYCLRILKKSGIYVDFAISSYFNYKLIFSFCYMLHQNHIALLSEWSESRVTNTYLYSRCVEIVFKSVVC